MSEHVEATYQSGDTDRSEIIQSPEQLEALMDEAAAHEYPVWLELVIPGETEGVFDNTVLWIGLGAPFSSLMYTERGKDGNRYDSVGTLGAPDGATFGYGGTPTSMPAGSAIEVAAARAAAIEFLATGQRSSKVDWVIYDPPYVEPEPFSWGDLEEVEPGEPGPQPWEAHTTKTD
ncbi:Imm1 family immunity protein [Kribbella sp. NPDC056861]|uniref:Imm1 family immunity protein n=1 Tax=Kribbella sp. NPDC056861 TaxID=3154857 RepID=UPI00341C22E5